MLEIDFVSPPVAQVNLLSQTENAPVMLALATRGYTQVYDSTITTSEVEDMLDQVERTKLKTPLEFVHTVWLLKDVTRSFTHQLVRYRVGIEFVQESLRFSQQMRPRILVPQAVGREPTLRLGFENACEVALEQYELMVGNGVPIQDARGVLPHSILTSIFVGVSLSTLAHIYEQRTCCQAQKGEWGDVLSKMKERLGLPLSRFLKTPWETGAASCGFGASFDRPCIHQDAFDRNLMERVELRK